MPKLKENALAAGFSLLLVALCNEYTVVDAFVAPPQHSIHHRRNDEITAPLLPPLHVLSRDLSQKMRYLDLERTGKDVDHENEAQVSASLYLNPAASKLAPHVQISWEPDAANIIKQLAKISNPSRPLMVGVVGIPGSGKSTSCDVLAAFIEDEFDAMVMPM
jgi:hypothetical protein